MRNVDRKHILLRRIVPSLALLLILTVALCSCGLTNFIIKTNGVVNRTEIESTGHQSGGTSQSAATDAQIREPEEEITLEKSEGFKNDQDKITSAGQAYNTVSEVYYAVCDSVVEITTETVKNSIWMGQYISEGAGSGVIISKDGFIVTNNHVIAGANQITVRLTDGSEYKAKLVGTDASADLAVIKIDVGDRELLAAGLGCSADLIVGEDVLAIGNPLGSLGGTLTTGIISATERSITVDGEEMVLLQTNAAINPGNSGGGLFNMAGELVGVVNAKMAGEDVEGLGFAIPVDFAHKIIEDLINYGYVRGVSDHGLILMDVTAQNLLTAYSKYGITSVGVVVLESELAKDLTFGDTIVSVNGKPVSSAYEVDIIIKGCDVGEKITVGFKRGDEMLETCITLVEKVPESISFE